jgi:hypothetical protein
MATKPRDWPANAKEARDQTAEAANHALRVLNPILNEFLYGKMAREEVIARVAIAINANQTIARLMESQGAQTQPPELSFLGAFEK